MTERPCTTNWAGEGLLAWIQHVDDRGVFVTDGAMVVRSWNRWLAQHTGHGEDEAIGRRLYDLYPSIVERGLDAFYADALAGEPRLLSERFHRHLLPLRRAVAGDMTDMAQSVRIEPLRIGTAVVGTVTIVDDVTERVITERELRTRIAAAERARQVAEDALHLKDDFLSALSQEIRTPLNSVIGWTRVLRSRLGADTAHTRALDAIERNGQKQLRLVDDLLAMSRIVSGRLRLSIGPTDIREVVRQAVDALASAIEAKSIVLRLSVDESVPALAADALRLQQAIWNVLANAVKFSRQGGAIDVAARKDGDRVLISVRDDGAGISPQLLPYVFDAFRQGDGSATRMHDGIGLGLTLARRIVELHGGEIGAESAGSGHGSLFWITLPLVQATPATGAAPSPLAVECALARIDVLAVDADPDARELTSALLAEWGATVHLAANGAEAIAMVQTGRVRPHVLVVDVTEGGASSLALLRSIRELSPSLRALPGVALGAYVDPNERIRALAAGFAHHLVKPLSGELLAATVSAAVHQQGEPEER